MNILKWRCIELRGEKNSQTLMGEFDTKRQAVIFMEGRRKMKTAVVRVDRDFIYSSND